MRHLSLCSGYGGLDMAAQAVFGGELAYVSDMDKGACKILAHRYPDVPNLGDLTVIDWASLGPIDVLTGGFPCQPFSHAGRRKGADDERHLWPYIRVAIRHLRPRFTLLENVAGFRSLGLDRVLGDMAEDGMHVRWTSIRASDVGAAHRRERVFLLVTPDAERPGRGPARTPAPGEAAGGRASAEPGGASGVPAAVTLLPTPAVNDMGEGKTVEAWDEWTAKMQASHANGNGHGKSLSIEAQRLPVALIPTPSVADATGGHATRSGARNGELLLPGVARAQAQGKLLPTTTTEPDTGNGHARNLGAEVKPDRWGQYAEAIARWESLTRPAPVPTELGPKGSPRLSARFSEWLMGLPDGWITDVPGITRNEALKAAGNGVVPQQAAQALRLLLAMGAVTEPRSGGELSCAS